MRMFVWQVNLALKFARYDTLTFNPRIISEIWLIESSTISFPKSSNHLQIITTARSKVQSPRSLPAIKTNLHQKSREFFMNRKKNYLIIHPLIPCKKWEERRKRSLCHLLSQEQISYKLPMTCHMLSFFFFTLYLFHTFLCFFWSFSNFNLHVMRRSEKGGGRRRKNAEHLIFYYSLLL